VPPPQQVAGASAGQRGGTGGATRGVPRRPTPQEWAAVTTGRSAAGRASATSPAQAPAAGPYPIRPGTPDTPAPDAVGPDGAVGSPAAAASAPPRVPGPRSGVHENEDREQRADRGAQREASRRRRRRRLAATVTALVVVVGGGVALAVGHSSGGGTGHATAGAGASAAASASTGAPPAGSAGGAADGAAPPASPSPVDPLFYLENATTDTAPLSAATFFGRPSVTVSGHTYTRATTATTRACAAAVSPALAAQLTAQHCLTVYRATYLAGGAKGGTAVTVGVAVFGNATQASAVRQNAKVGNVDPLYGKGVPVFCKAVTCRMSINALGRYAYFTVAGYTNGKPVPPKDTTALAAATDGANLVYDVLASRARVAAAAATRAG